MSHKRLMQQHFDLERTLLFIERWNAHQSHPITNGELSAQNGVDVLWTFDERINDGFYCAESLAIVRRYIEEPELLMLMSEQQVDEFIAALESVFTGLAPVAT